MRKLYKLTLLLIVILLGNNAMAYDFSAVCSTGQTLYYTITSDIEPYTVSVATENEEYPFYNTTPTGDLEIPESVEFNSITYSVTGLIDYALQHCNGLTSVTIPNSVTSIGAYAFYGCSGLSEITIPSSVTEIGDEAFVSCSGLTTVNFNAETSTGSSIFTGCSFTTLNIGENVKVIPAQAFMYCGGLTEVIISDSVTTIGDRAFNECSSLATLTIGKSVASIGNSVFINNSGLTTVYYNATNCATVPTYNWGGCSSLTTLNIGESVKNIPDYLFRDCSGLTGTLVIPDSVTNIGASAFYNCSGYETLTLGKSVETIGNNAFYGCNFSTLNYNAANCSSTSFSGNSNITTITIGEDVKTISNGAFSACTGLTTVNFNATNCTTMGSSSNPVFYNCTSLATINISEGVTNIPSYAFYQCSALTRVNYSGTITQWCGITFGAPGPLYDAHNLYINNSLVTDLVIPDIVTEINDYAFRGATCLTSVTIPESITNIGTAAFSSCSELTTVNFNAINCTTMGSAGVSVFSSCTSLSTLNIGDNVKNIPANAFKNCSGLETITIGNSIESIGDYAFSDCSSLTSVYVNDISKWCAISFDGLSTYANPLGLAHNLYINNELVTDLVLPDTITEIKPYVFQNATCMASVTIPSSVTSIGYQAFYGCTSLATVNFNAENCTTMGSLSSPAFFNCPLITTLNIGERVKNIPNNAFRECTGLIEITIPDSIISIGEWAFGACSGLTTVNFNPKNCTTMGSSGRPAFYNCSSFANLNIGERVKSIPDNAFYGCTGLNEITIPDSVTSIGSYAFSGCTGISEITIPDSVTSIGGYAFSDCTGLTTVNFNAENCTSMGGTSTFSNCTFTTLNIGERVKTIPDNAFYNCSGLTEITIPDSVTSIGDRAFYGCTGLTTVNFNAQNCTTMGSYGMQPLEGCTALNTLNIGVNVKNIPDYAFYGCSGLSEITIPDSVTNIGTYALGNCSSLGSITIGKNIESIGDRAFYNCTELTTVNFNAENCTTMGSQSMRIFEGCTALNALNIGANVKNIPDYAFYGCSGLTGTLTIPDSVTNIGNYAFSNCAMDSLTIGNSVESISAHAFYICNTLTYVTIGESVETIGDFAFSYCDNIAEINAFANTPPELGNQVFRPTPYSSAVVKVPCSTLGAYSSASGWSSFSNIQERFDYTLTVSSDNEQQGTASITQQPSCSENGIISATPAEGYRFLSWNDGNEDNPRTVIVTSDSTFSAGFKAAYIITASAGEGGTITPSGETTVDEGESQSFVITPLECYAIASVLVDGEDVTADLVEGVYTFDNVTTGHTIYATFEQITYTIMASAGENGTITPDGIAVVACGSDKAFSITPNDCYRIASVLVDDEDATDQLVEGVYTFENVTTDHTITATFEQMTYTITVTAGENGTITPDGAVSANCGEDKEFLITANEHYYIASVLVDDVDVTDQLVEGVYTFENVTANHTIEATFEEIPSFTITVSANNDEYGSVSGSGTYEEGAEVIITAIPNEGYQFVSWSDDNTDNPRTITVTSDSTFVAIFEHLLESYTITVSANNDEYGSVAGGGTYDEGAEVVITAIPNEGYRFVSWDDENTDNPRTITVTSDSTFVAIFEVEPLQQYTITVLSNDEEYGMVSGGGTYDEGSTVIITAIPNIGYCFLTWSDGNTDNPREIVVTADRSYTAYFTASTHVEIDTTVTKYLSIYERTFYVAGQYSFVVPSAEGCDTIVDLNLRILDEPETYDISPNPAKSLISISSEDYISFVEFYSTAGRLVMRNEINAYSAEINVEALMPGVYFVRLYGEDESLPSVQRFVKE